MAKVEFKYQSFIPMKQKEYKWFLERCLRLPKGSRILDAGCGTSIIVDRLNAKGYEAWGVDINLNRKGNYRAEDMRKLSFPDKYFDMVICINTLENVGIGAYGDKREYDGDRNALAEFRRVLKDNGQIVVAVAFGQACLKQRNHPFRVYNEPGLKWLTRGLCIKERHYFYFEVSTEDWRETNYPEQVEAVFTREEADWMGNLFMVLVKQNLTRVLTK